MITDPIADVITRIRNAGLAGHKTVLIPLTKMSFEILRILDSRSYIDSFMEYTEKGSLKNDMNKNNVISTRNLFFCKTSVTKIINCSRGEATLFAYPVDGINASRCIFPPYISTHNLNGAFLVFLSYVQKDGCKKQPKIEKLKRISKSSRRVYWKFENMPRIQDGFGFAILTTSNFGIITDDEARKKRVGGEVLIAASRRI